MIILIEADNFTIQSLRNDYLESLPYFQEYFLEQLIETSLLYKIESNNESIGYAIKSSDDIFLEFYMKEEWIGSSHTIFPRIIKDLAIKHIYCKSFDSLLRDCCLMQGYSYSVIGALFRDIVETTDIDYSELSFRYADLNDLPFLQNQEDEVFEPLDNQLMYIESNSILMFYRNNEFVGCGFLTKVHPQFNYYDVGLWTDPACRNQGIGTKIIAYLKKLCFEKKGVPICGCEISNEASIKVLHKNGFVSRHKIIQFEVP
jgi:RimJ/RimL family protein N-acetyltransferase